VLYATYSFENIIAAITGPGGQFPIGGPDTGAAEEGLECTWGEENNTQNIGAAGDVMNSMHASRAGTFTVRLQLVSPVNALLNKLWAFQRSSGGIYWGRNTITVRDVMRGDLYTNSGCAFVRHTTATWPKIGTVRLWEFHVAKVDPYLGSGWIDGH
jgi:hypothetical protein